MWWWMNFAVGWTVFLLWSALAGPSTLLLRFRNLRRRSNGLAEPDDWPRVSVIVTARDEASSIEENLRSLLASDYPGLEIIAVDDRSRDETGSLMERISADNAKLQVVHVTDLPDDWLGKNHAMHIGAQAAQGELLLFTDGDVIFAPAAIRLAVLYMISEQFDHLCLMPLMVRGGYWETALVSYFALIFAMGTQPWLVSTAIKRAYIGAGAFNLVRKAAYDQFGGHAPIRYDILDDVKLGKLVKQSGFRQDVLLAEDLVRVRWQASAWGAIRGLEKNGFASHEYSIARMALSTVVFCVMFVVPYVAVCVFHDWSVSGFVVSIGLAHLIYGCVATSIGGGWRVVPALPIAALGMLFAFWRSTFLTLRQGGVQWRDTFYPLEKLRKNLYR